MNYKVALILGLLSFFIGCSFISSNLPLQSSTSLNAIPEKTAAICPGDIINAILVLKADIV